MKKGPSKMHNTDNTTETLLSHERDLLATRPSQSVNQQGMTLNMNSVDTNISTVGIDSAHEKKVHKQIKKIDSLICFHGKILLLWGEAGPFFLTGTRIVQI